MICEYASVCQCAASRRNGAAADGARRAEQPLSQHVEPQHQAEVLKLKEEIQQRLQQQVRARPFDVAVQSAVMRLQVLALRRVVADVESSASLAAVASVKLHNKNRWSDGHDV